MRICNGPQLMVPRAGRLPHMHRYSWHPRFDHGARTYDEYLARERARIRALPSVSVADCKRPVVYSRCIEAGASFRMVDRDGRSFGVRYVAPSTLPLRTRVRRVDRQPEDYHSLVSRMLKRAHRLILQTQI